MDLNFTSPNAGRSKFVSAARLIQAYRIVRRVVPILEWSRYAMLKCGIPVLRWTREKNGPPSPHRPSRDGHTPMSVSSVGSVSIVVATIQTSLTACSVPIAGTRHSWCRLFSRLRGGATLLNGRRWKCSSSAGSVSTASANPIRVRLESCDHSCVDRQDGGMSGPIGQI